MSMCNIGCLEFGRAHLSEEDVRGKAVLEVGSRDVNGSLRSIVQRLGPATYIGVDLEPGAGVDEVVRAENLRNRFGDASFDLVIATEVVEHVRDWRRVVRNVKTVLRPNGVLLLTTRSLGFPYHGYPHDYWRYEVADMREIFSDFLIDALVPDLCEPGVFLKARKPGAHSPAALGNISLHSMISGRRVRTVRAADVWAFRYGRWRAEWAAHKRDVISRCWHAPVAHMRSKRLGASGVGSLPFGHIDTPKAGDRVAGQVHIAGWALSDTAIAEVSIYLDRKRVGRARLYGDRPDVAIAFPRYASSRTAGWAATLDFSELADATRALSVEALAKSGARAIIGSVEIAIDATR